MSPGPSVSGRLRPAGLGGRPACYMSPGPGGAGRLRTAGPGRAGRGRPGAAAPAGPRRPPRTGQPGGVSIYGLEYLRFSAKPPQSVLAAWPPMVNVEASLKKFSSLAWFAV